MTTIYKCDTCGREFKGPKECRMCEVSHMTPVDRIKYMIMLSGGVFVIIVIIHIMSMVANVIVSTSIANIQMPIKTLFQQSLCTTRVLVAYETF